MASQITNTPVPSVHLIPGRMFLGRTIKVRGDVAVKGNSFSINLQSSSSKAITGDVAFHFNPRLKEGHVVCNTMTHDTWGKQEMYGMPFARGSPFDVEITCSQNSYRVIVNNKPFCNYEHRLPYENVSYIFIQGDVVIQSIWFSAAEAK